LTIARAGRDGDDIGGRRATRYGECKNRKAKELDFALLSWEIFKEIDSGEVF